MPAVSNITKVSDGPSEDAIVNLHWVASGDSKSLPTTLLDVSTLDAPSGQAVKAVSIQEIWVVTNVSSTVEFYWILDSANTPIIMGNRYANQHQDFTSGGCCPGLPASDQYSVGATGDLRYAVGVSTNTNSTWVDADIGEIGTKKGFNITLRVRKIYEDA